MERSLVITASRTDAKTVGVHITVGVVNIADGKVQPRSETLVSKDLPEISSLVGDDDLAFWAYHLAGRICDELEQVAYAIRPSSISGTDARSLRASFWRML
ncbi:MAG TPA: hypothetical protein VGR84_19240 [Candidatus Acidoferrales bacterium]|nr:hypothetical protein [Candidatus Acidoferrales bacterium]